MSIGESSTTFLCCFIINRESEIYKTFYYYESTKRKLKTKYICGCRCYERLQSNTTEFTRLSYTELVRQEGKKINFSLFFFRSTNVRRVAFVFPPVKHVEVLTMGVAESEAFSWNPDSFVWNER
jgi:hypothetical protein